MFKNRCLCVPVLRIKIEWYECWRYRQYQKGLFTTHITEAVHRYSNIQHIFLDILPVQQYFQPPFLLVGYL